MTLRDYLYEKLLFKSECTDDFIIYTSNNLIVDSGSYADILESIRDGRLNDESLDSLVIDEFTIKSKCNSIAYNIVKIAMEL